MAGRYLTEEVISIICGDVELEQDDSDTLELEQDDSDTLELEQDKMTACRMNRAKAIVAVKLAVVDKEQ